jgi:putative hydrolase of the HAD superfamily
MTRQHLIIDADDTLWENNIYFEQAFDAFLEFLAHSSLPTDDIRSILDEIELANIKVHGYGAKNFARNLCQCYERLVERELLPGDLDHIMQLAERIMTQPLEIIDAVPETLQYLSMRHDLTLFTKGHAEEQKLKIDRSELGVWFGHTAIVPEKDAASYQRLVDDRKFDPAKTWMIGNSPKSDINPALAAGLNAVFVPHPRTWHLEKTPLSAGPGKVITVERFADLAKHF